jgi:hypothetical protein
VHVHVGPIAAGSASVWIAFARQVLETRRSAGEGGLAPEVLEGFVGFLDEWQAIASSSDPFLWDSDVDAEQVEFLALALHRIATELDAEAQQRGYRLMPADGEPFYRAVVSGFLDAMSSENATLAAYAEDLRSSWPGLASDEGTISDNS